MLTNIDQKFVTLVVIHRVTMIVILIVEISEVFELWFRLDNGPEIDEIPPNTETLKMTLSEILEARGTHKITHMFIEQCNIPDSIDQIAPELIQLRLDRIPNIDSQISR